jgi:hypothetical protein
MKDEWPASHEVEKMKKLFAGSLSRSHWVGPFKAKADVPVVRLMDSPRRLPGTPLEQRVISTLKETGPVSFAKLVKTIAGEVYAEELRKGSGVLDIGLFGSRLFNSDVIRELEAGDGVLWEIKHEREIL